MTEKIAAHDAAFRQLALQQAPNQTADQRTNHEKRHTPQRQSA